MNAFTRPPGARGSLKSSGWCRKHRVHASSGARVNVKSILGIQACDKKQKNRLRCGVGIPADNNV
ncbi:hypothetical protein PISMIDRAFT_671887, partial [Pisolithus microcarpus 441]